MRGAEVAVSRLDLTEISFILPDLRSRRSSFLLFAEREIDRALFISEGWLDVGMDNAAGIFRLASVGAEYEALLGRIFGWFDDPETGIDIFGSCERMHALEKD